MTFRGLARVAQVVALAALCGGAGSVPAPAGAQEAGDLLVKKGARSGDQWLLAYTVDVHGVVLGDVTAAGIQAGLDGSVQGDVNLAGVRVRVGGIVGDDARALGAHVVVQGSVADGLLVGGGDVEVTRNTYIGGPAMVAAGRARLLGDFHGDLQVAAGAVELDGEADRTVTIRSDDVAVGPRALLRGDLVVRGASPPRVAEGARIEGKVIHEPPRSGGATRVLVEAGWAALLQAGMLAVALAFLLAAPGLERAAAGLRLRGMGLPEATGALALVALPVIVPLVAATIVGIPAALGIAATAVLLALAAWSAAAVALSASLRRRFRPAAAPARLGERLAWTWLALLLLRAAATLPVAGWTVVGAALLLGAAAVGRAVWTGRSGGGRSGDGGGREEAG